MKLSFKDIKSKLSQSRTSSQDLRTDTSFPYFSSSPLNVSDFQLTSSLALIPDYIPPELESSILEQGVYSQPLHKWTTLRNRRLQMWGGDVTPSGLESQQKLPNWLDIFSQRLVDEGIFNQEHRPNHVLINEYQKGEGIMPHTDGPLYYPLVAILSLGSECLFQLYKLENGVRTPDFAVYIPRRSLLLFWGDTYIHKLHAIEFKGNDYLYGCNCGAVYSETADGVRTRVVNCPEMQDSEREVEGSCLECGGKLRCVYILYRETRVSFTIRHVTEYHDS
jgi:alkylated DNA repair protein alkB family protein 6